MATVNFSVPDEVKKTFDRAFAGANKSAVIAQLMREAVEERRRQERRQRAIEKLLQLRRRMKPVTQRRLREARASRRP